MPSGVQVFDEKGNLIIDLTTRKIEYVRSVTVTLQSSSSTYVDVAVDGVTPSEFYVLCNKIIVGKDEKGIRLYNGHFATIIDTGTVRLSTSRLISKGDTWVFYIYRFK